MSSFMLRTQQFVAGALWRTAHHSLCTNVHASPEYEFRECSHRGGAFDAAVWTLLLGSRPRLPASQQSSPGPPTSRLSAAHDALLRTDACAFAPPSGDSHTVCTTHRATRKADSTRAAANRSHAAVLSPVALVSRIIARNRVFAQVGEKEFVAVGSGALPPPDPAPCTPRAPAAARFGTTRRAAAQRLCTRRTTCPSRSRSSSRVPSAAPPRCSSRPSNARTARRARSIPSIRGAFERPKGSHSRAHATRSPRQVTRTRYGASYMHEVTAHL